MVVTEALELPAVGLTGAPDVADGVLAVVRGRHPVDDVVLGLVLQAAVMVESPRPGARHDVRLEEVLAGRHVAVEEVGAAVVRPPVPREEKISRRVSSIIIIYVLLKPALLCNTDTQGTQNPLIGVFIAFRSVFVT